MMALGPVKESEERGAFDTMPRGKSKGAPLREPPDLLSGAGDGALTLLQQNSFIAPLMGAGSLILIGRSSQ